MNGNDNQAKLLAIASAFAKFVDKADKESLDADIGEIKTSATDTQNI